MLDTGTGGRHLEVPTLEYLGVSHGVLVLELPIHKIREDLELAVGVGSEPGSGLDPVFVEDTQVSKTRVFVITIRGKRERVEGLEPTVVSTTPLDRGPEDQLGGGHIGSSGGG